MQAWKRIEPTINSRIGYRHIITKTFIQPNGQVHHYETTSQEGRQSAGVIGLTPDNRVVIARQFRPGPEKIMDEIPGGAVEAADGDDYLVAAKREFEEETGYVVGDITYLGAIHKDAFSNGTWHYYFATDCVPNKTGQHLDDTEHIEVDLVGIDQFLANARCGLMTDTEAVFLAYDKLQNAIKS